MPLAVEQRGTEGPLLVLLHGLGANLTVWDRLLTVADWPGRTLTVDLRGHGYSPMSGPFAPGVMAADVATTLLAGSAPIAGSSGIHLLGHSLGGAVGLLLASGMFGLTVDRVAVFGVKAAWDPGLVNRLHASATAPARTYPTHAEALSRALTGAGLRDVAEVSDRFTERAVTSGPGGWRVTTAPGTNLVAGQLVTAVARDLRCPLAVLHGSTDPLVSADEAAALGPAPHVLSDAGHQPHVTHPDALWRWASHVLTTS